MSLDSFQEIFHDLFHRGGGRRPQEKNQKALDDQDGKNKNKSWMKPCASHQARLTIVHITDVYTLDNFPSLKTLLEQIRASQAGAGKVVSMLTGDFLSPYLLSALDEGDGMMMAINSTPIDYLTWGNHEADIPHRKVCKHIKNYKGTFINSNMQSHDSMEYDVSVPYEIIEVQSPDGKQTRKIGLVALLSNDPKLYSHFKEPAFGGATIEDPWETLSLYKRFLEDEHGCDLVIPLEHLYVHENQKTTEMFDLPLILSGHDHHRIDQIMNGTRLIKPGMDGVYAAVVEIVWDDNNANSIPRIRSTFVKTNSFDPCPVLKTKTDAAYDVLLPLRNTMLAGILPSFRPLSSKNARGSVCTMGKLICSMLKQSLTRSSNHHHTHDFTDDNNQQQIDAVILMGGNIRGNEDYPDDAFFSLETLEAEIEPDEVIGFVDMPGHVLKAGIEATHSGDPIPGWFQYDDGIQQNKNDGQVTHVGGKPIQLDKVYRVATKIKDLTNGQSPPLTAYYKSNPELLPSKGQYLNIHSELMKFFARGMFRKLWEATGEMIPDPQVVAEEATYPPNMERIEGKLRLSVLDRDRDGYVTVDDIHVGLRDFLGLSVDDNYKNLAEHVFACADVTGNGQVSVEDFEIFCATGMPIEFKLQPKWQEAFPDPLPELILSSSSSAAEVLEQQIHRSCDNLHTTPADAYADGSHVQEATFLKRHDTETTDLVDMNDLPSEIITIQAIDESDESYR